MTPLKARSFKFDPTTSAELDWLRTRYGTHTRALAVAIDLLYQREFAVAEGTTHYQNPQPVRIEAGTEEK